MGLGRDFARKNSRYLSFDEKGMIEGVFENMKSVVKEVFGEEKEVMRYTISGRIFDSSSTGLAVQMDSIESQTKIRITKKGQGINTKYIVEKI